MSKKQERENKRRAIWLAPMRAALEQIADAIATIPAEQLVEHELLQLPSELWSSGAALWHVLKQRHPEVYQAYNQALEAHNAAMRQKYEQEAIARREAQRRRRHHWESMGYQTDRSRCSKCGLIRYESDSIHYRLGGHSWRHAPLCPPEAERQMNESERRQPERELFTEAYLTKLMKNGRPQRQKLIWDTQTH
jgi:hypothetical protein